MIVTWHVVVADAAGGVVGDDQRVGAGAHRDAAGRRAGVPQRTCSCLPDRRSATVSPGQTACRARSIVQVGRGSSMIVTWHGFVLTQPRGEVGDDQRVGAGADRDAAGRRAGAPQVRCSCLPGRRSRPSHPGRPACRERRSSRRRCRRGSIADGLVADERSAAPLLKHGDWNVPSTLTLFTCSPAHSAVRPTRSTIVHEAPTARLNGP